MKQSDFKKIIKEAVKEAIQEELKDILLEAIKAPKMVVKEATYEQPKKVIHNSEAPTIDRAEIKARMLEMMENGGEAPPTEFRPTTRNTIAEGSSLPPGEVSLNQIMGLMG